jgi:hypothetical protein
MKDALCPLTVPMILKLYVPDDDEALTVIAPVLGSTYTKLGTVPVPEYVITPVEYPHYNVVVKA